jgi:RNA polymerase sigma factor (sigma-70 family)
MARLRSDELLVSRAKKGDRGAFEAIYQRYHQDLYRFCLMLVGNRQDAEEALQGTMVKLIRSLPGEQREIKLRPWIFRIARNESIDTLRSRRESVAIEPEELPQVTGVAETVEAREQLRKLITDLSELPERQRVALLMRELAGLEFGEIGPALNTSAATARQTIYEARISLRQMEVGREMRCEQILWEISESDGRRMRGREIQAHLRSCPECRAFQNSIVRRRGELGALAPLPVAASAALLQGALSAGSGAGGAGAAGAVGAGAGKALVGSAAVKTAATCAVVAVLGAAAADRSGLVDVPLGGEQGSGREPPAPTKPVATPVGTGLAAEGTEASRRRRPDSGHSTSPALGRVRPVDRVPAEAPTGAEGEKPAANATAPESTTVPSTGQRPVKKHGGGGGGHGQGKAEGLPPASDQGQQTAAAHKSPQGNPSPGTPRGVAKGQSSNPPASQPNSNASPEKGQPATEAAEPPTHGNAGATPHGGGGGHESESETPE